MNVKNQHKVVFSLFFPIAIAITNLVSFEGPLKFSLLILGTLLFFAVFINTNFALVILIFSMLLSPEFQLGGVPGRAVVLRIDDILLFIVFFGWLAKMAINKEFGLLRITPLNKPILVYIFVCLLSTGMGIQRGTTDPKYSFFYILKYVEYFILFFMVSNNIRDKKQIKMFLFFMLFTCFIVSIYALRSHFLYGVRASAPFEGKAGEPNTLAGYLLLMMGITFGSFVYTRSLKLRLLSGGFLVFIMCPFLFTLSRGGWFGFLPMYITFMILSKQYKAMLLLLLIFLIVASPFILPRVVIERYKATFVPGKTYTVLGRKISLDESASLRIKSAKGSLKAWSQYPILGRGVPGGGVVSDVQYTRILREVGIIGFLAFIWIIVTLFKVGMRSFTHPQVDSFGKGLSLGFTSALVGLLVMGVAAEVFIIIRIMEPFWFLAAIVVMLPEISLLPQKED